ncbi:hypothetical protein HFO56_23265 [Rhizobium laguerreae]|uniref:hypothetical protein n=1 Tax=Rhizobium laguerreae TaxID=1076926 RepID=UPI001C91A873|nr:hypothetical protein [Rhizobium laguerreae]MBY3155246.1 hypothetical protein [Rhizobium laguerreae]
MSAFTSRELTDHANLNADGMTGFETQIALKSFKREVVWPEHLRGKRVDDFRRGSEIARAWMAMRSGVGMARRKVRLKERQEIGIMTVLGPENAAEHKAEQIATLKQAAAQIDRIAKLHLENENPSQEIAP